MTIYEFYIQYVLTRKATLVSTYRTPLNVSVSNGSVWINHIAPTTSSPIKISYEEPVTYLASFDIEILLCVDPVFLAASTLTGVISIPVPIPDKLPF